MPNIPSDHRSEIDQADILRLSRELDKARDENRALLKQRNNLAYNSGNQLAKTQRELEKCQADAALVINALNGALQLTEALIAFLPDGMVLSEGVATAKSALDRAMDALHGRRVIRKEEP